MLESKDISHDIAHIRTRYSDQILRLQLQRQLFDNASPVRRASRNWSGWRDRAPDSDDGLSY